MTSQKSGCPLTYASIFRSEGPIRLASLYAGMTIDNDRLLECAVFFIRLIFPTARRPGPRRSNLSRMIPRGLSAHSASSPPQDDFQERGADTVKRGPGYEPASLKRTLVRLIASQLVELRCGAYRVLIMLFDWRSGQVLNSGGAFRIYQSRSPEIKRRNSWWR